MKRALSVKNRLIVSAVLLLVSGAFLLGFRHVSTLLDSQRAAERWQGENETQFAQVSCFAPADNKLTPEQIYNFRGEIVKKLNEASFDTGGEMQLFNDAWSTEGTVKVSGERKSGEVRAIAVGGSFFDFHPIRLVSGNYIRPDDLMKDRVLLDRETSWLLFGGTDLSGLSFSINGVPFVVAGVIEREDDKFSEQAYTGGMGIYMSYDAYAAITENAGISCYELVMAEPVKHFVLNFAREKFPIGQGEIVDNSYRYDTDRMLKLGREGMSRSMQTGSAVYPYWENAARGTEDRCAAFLTAAVSFAVLPAVLLLIMAVQYIIKGKTGLEEELIPKAKESIEESIRIRARRRWEKKHPNMK